MLEGRFLFDALWLGLTSTADLYANVTKIGNESPKMSEKCVKHI